ncbi:MAG: HlyD family efflux transporter periplasmic adaptor subunit [Tepidisphaera sp.]|nr:HlyD family efflux transporter periplasmic adaptor subunit [Tepidisphaera sp.]
MALTDLSSLRTPGWQRVVGELSSPTGDDRVFLLRLLGVLGQVSGARQAVLWTLTGSRDDAMGIEPRAALVWPFGPDVVDAQGRMTVPIEALFDAAKDDNVEGLAEVRSAARAAAHSRQSEIYGLESEGLMYDPQAVRGYVIALPVAWGLPAESSGLPLQGVVTLMLDGRSRQAVQTTLALVEVLAGYVFTHTSQQALRRVRASSASLELAARLIASINQTRDFKGAVIQFVNDLCRQLGVDRVAMGFAHGSGSRPGGEGPREIRVTALSDTENLDRRMAMVQRLEGAMNECLDQEQPVLYPPPSAEGDAILAQAVTHAHRELAALDANLKVASLPVRVSDASGDRIIGVVLIESAGQGAIDVGTVELLQATLDLVGPVLDVRRREDRMLALRVYDSGVKAGAWLVGPKHTVWKLAGVALLGLSLFSVLYTTPYRVGAPMELQPRVKRIISMPFDGVLDSVPKGVEAGQRVKAGDVLAKLDTRMTTLSELEAAAQVLQYEKQADEALRKGDLAESDQNRARADQYKAQRDLMKTQVERSTITSPINGLITSGDLKDKVGAAVKLGEKLYEVADTSDMQVIAKVDDRDIALIHEGQTGQISPKADPSLKVDFIVEQIVPASQAEEGKNVFEVRGRLTGAEMPSWLLPGVEGQAKFNAERHSLAWIASRRVLDQLRIWLWW